MKKPDFIIAGYQKCGTTALWKNLQQHPKIYMASRLLYAMPDYPEIDFFNEKTKASTWNNGFDWYKSLFKEGFVCGEKSPSYHSAAERIQQYLPDVKIIMSLRNPTDRAFSAYFFYKKMLPESANWGGFNNEWNPEMSFLHNFIDNNVFKKMGKYINTLKEFYKYFPSKNIHIVIQERLINNHQTEYNKLFDFLHLEPIDIINNKAHVTAKRKMFDEERDLLNAFYKPYNDQLFELLGYKIPEWK